MNGVSEYESRFIVLHVCLLDSILVVLVILDMFITHKKLLVDESLTSNSYRFNIRDLAQLVLTIMTVENV